MLKHFNFYCGDKTKTIVLARVWHLIRNSLVNILDIFLINITFIMVLLLRFEGTIPVWYQKMYVKQSILLTIIFIGTFALLSLYKSLWNYASIREICQIVIACILGDLIFWGVNRIRGQSFLNSIYIIYPIFLMSVMSISRMSYRVIRRIKKLYDYEWKKHRSNNLEGKVRILLIGAGSAARMIIKDIQFHVMNGKEVVLCIDDNLDKQGHLICGVPIGGTTKDILALVNLYHIDEIIIAMPSASRKRISEILQVCKETTCKIRIFSGLEKMLDNIGDRQLIYRDVNIEDLLGREEIVLNHEKLNPAVQGKTILVTGGGGSIGSELCRQLVQLKPYKLIIFDIYENNAYDLQMELIQKGISKDKLIIEIGSVRDLSRVKSIFNRYRPQIIFHAAAHKHVPLMEDNPEEAVKNNIFGTLHVAQCAKNYQAEKFVLVSTDKAVNPTNVMGATKRVCEMIIQSMNDEASCTDYVAVRFGNVLGSNGSVVPLFKRQIAAGGPLTVTHPDIIRYFMTIPEAASLILEASTYAKGGEIFILDMGEPVKIYDLARNFIKLLGLQEGKDIHIEFTGLRPGEKLYEELLTAEEGLNKTVSDKIFVGHPQHMSYKDLSKQLDELRNCLEASGDIRVVLKKIVPTYHTVEVPSLIKDTSIK